MTSHFERKHSQLGARFSVVPVTKQVSRENKCGEGHEGRTGLSNARVVCLGKHRCMYLAGTGDALRMCPQFLDFFFL